MILYNNDMQKHSYYYTTIQSLLNWENERTNTQFNFLKQNPHSSQPILACSLYGLPLKMKFNPFARPYRLGGEHVCCSNMLIFSFSEFKAYVHYIGVF